MSDYLSTTGVSSELEKIIKEARRNLWIISPYLKVNARIQELLKDADRHRFSIDLVYGKVDLSPDETEWLASLDSVKTWYLENLHAKCYANEDRAIVTSMNLYQFSQQNNHEMGILIHRETEPHLFSQVEEAVREFTRHADARRLSAVKVSHQPSAPVSESKTASTEKLSTSKLAKRLGVKTQQMSRMLIRSGYLQGEGDSITLTEAGKLVGGELKSSKFGPYFAWPIALGDEL